MESQTFFDILTNPIVTIAIGFAYIILAITASNVLVTDFGFIILFNLLF